MALNPQILRWARETADLPVDEAAQTLGFKDTRGRTAAERLLAMEAGEEEPSRSVLLKMAHAYHRSLLVFYLSAPPRTGDRGQDFRRAPGVKPDYDATLDALIRDIRGRQSIVRDLREQTDSKSLDYIASVTTATPPQQLAKRITERLGFSLAEFRQQSTTPTAPFNYLREKVEASGAFVLLLGNLGSYHTNIPSGVFRGYAIADQVAPFIVVNDQDAPIAWAFTTLHEVTHLWLGATGLSGSSTDMNLEAYCNSVAGEILLPERDTAELGFLCDSSLQETIEAVARFAASRKISRLMVAYKLLRLDIINYARWRELDKYYEEERLKAQVQQLATDKDEGGPSYYVLKRHRLGQALLDLVKNSLTEGFLTHTKAGQILGVKPRNVDPLIYAAGLRRGQ